MSAQGEGAAKISAAGLDQVILMISSMNQEGVITIFLPIGHPVKIENRKWRSGKMTHQKSRK
jgi:hypothetical protein